MNPVQRYKYILLSEYFTEDNSRLPIPDFADYPLGVYGITTYEPRFDPRFTLLAQRFLHNNDTLSEKRRELEF